MTEPIFYQLLVSAMGAIVFLVTAWGYSMRQTVNSHKIILGTVDKSVDNQYKTSDTDQRHNHEITQGLLAMLGSSQKTNEALAANIQAQTDRLKEQSAQTQKGFLEVLDAASVNRAILEQNLGIFSVIPTNLNEQTATLTTHQKEQTALVLASIEHVRGDLMDMATRLQRTSGQIETIQAHLLHPPLAPLPVVPAGGESSEGVMAAPLPETIEVSATIPPIQ